MTISLDDEYFESVGLAGLPPEIRQSLAAAIYSETESRVGQALVDGMSDEELEEFEKIFDKDEATVRRVLDEYDHENYQNNRDKPLEVLAVEAGRVWLTAHRPSYQDTVRAVHEELKSEVKARRLNILATEGVAADNAAVAPDALAAS